MEAIWDEHCLFEFGERDVEKTMGTMVDEPYVNHIPTVSITFRDDTDMIVLMSVR